jgi:hypothetical protein
VIDNIVRYYRLNCICETVEYFKESELPNDARLYVYWIAAKYAIEELEKMLMEYIEVCK